MSATEVVVDTPLTLADRFSSLLTLVDDQTKTHTSFMKTVNSELKALQKELSKAQPKSRKKNKKEPVDGEDVVKRKNVFDVPVPISDELCEFLGVEKGQMVSRQFVTNSITKYVKDNEIQNPENRRYILLDTTDAGRKLNTLLSPDQPLTFFNMQRYLKPHYPKVDKGEATDRTDTSTESSESVEEKPKKKVRAKKDPEVDAVVPDADVVDDTPGEETEPKKKIRRAVRKA
jgi:chromatin remodeling complex protein RSC6